MKYPLLPLLAVFAVVGMPSRLPAQEPPALAPAGDPASADLASKTLVAETTTDPTSRPLFNGTDLSGWNGDGYVVENGVIVATPAARNLVTTATFAYFVLDFEFLLTPGANNGLGINYPGAGDSAYNGLELQILDNGDPKYKDLKDAQFHGSIYQLAAAKRQALKPAGEWNHERVTVTDSGIVVELNGEIILRRGFAELEERFPKHEGLKRRGGHIAFLGHGDKVSFKNIRIAERPPAANDRNVVSQGFARIFDGRSLTGWKHDPATRNWTAIGGLLKHDGTAAEIKDLWTEKEYGDFSMVLDWRWSGRGKPKAQPVVLPNGGERVGADGQLEKEEIEELDSGIYLRGFTKAQVNLWNWSVGSGEVYGYRTDATQPSEVREAVTPKVHADRKIGEWNRMMITVKGDRVTVMLNDKIVIENAALPGVPPRGPIGLQHHGQPIEFANLWIKEL